MEIVQIAGLYPPHLGGEEAVVERLAILQADRHAVTVYTSTLGAKLALREEVAAGRAGHVRVHRLWAGRVSNTPVMPTLLLRLLTHRPRPDVLHVHTGQAIVPEVVALAARMRRLPYVAHQHLMVRPSSRIGRVLLPLYYRALYRPFLRRADMVICLTASMRNELVRNFDLDSDRIVVVGNGVDTARCNRKGDERRSAEFLFVGRLSAQKNVDALLDAVAELERRGRSVSIRIIGDGEEGARLQGRAHTLGLADVTFEGRLQADAVASAYARATAVVMPSTHEGMPLVLLEAMSAGAPVVASALPELIEVGADAILAVDPLTPATLADALERILEDPALADSLSASALMRVERYDWARVAGQIEDVYTRVLRARR